jgi:hypothetical protein
MVRPNFGITTSMGMGKAVERRAWSVKSSSW